MGTRYDDFEKRLDDLDSNIANMTALINRLSLYRDTLAIEILGKAQTKLIERRKKLLDKHGVV